ncbi:MAG: peptide chain release factor 1 [Dehalococcoidia bacterium]
MLDRLESLEKRYEELNRLLAQPEVATIPERLEAVARERATLEEVVAKYREYRAVSQSLEETRALLDDGLDSDMMALVKDELGGLSARQDRLLGELKLALVSQDPNDTRDVIVEIRAGTGGNEAALFAADLFRMYSRYAQSKGWETEIIDANESGIGGLREIVFEIRGRGAYSRLKYERGVHRVQRVPLTEASGRIHTSTATVAVLPEVEEVEVDIDPSELKVDFFHSRGAGGQNVNKVATAVRITHLPTGLVAICQDERSQLRNRTKAMAVLRARLRDREQQKQREEISRERRSQVGTGERAEKVRTYNFPQDRLTDHRIGLTLHNLPRIMEGEIDELIDTLATAEQAQRLEAELV